MKPKNLNCMKIEKLCHFFSSSWSRMLETGRVNILVS